MSLTARSVVLVVAVAAAAFGIAFVLGGAVLGTDDSGAVDVPKLELPSEAPRVQGLGVPAAVPPLRPAPAPSGSEDGEGGAPAPVPPPAPAPSPAPAPPPADAGDTIIEG